MQTPPTAPPLRSRFARPLLYALVIIAVAIALKNAPARTDELARRTACLANLRDIGRALHDYQQKYAADPASDPIAALVAAGLLDATQARCPNGGPYILVLQPHPIAPDPNPRRILAYEPASNHQNEIINALFSDGHAESIRADEFRAPD